MIITILFIVISLDQLLKIYVANTLLLGESIVVFPNILSLTNLHNFGAAWGSFSGYRLLLIFITVICITALMYCYIFLSRSLTIRSKIIISLIVAGSIGNLIDRLVYGYVRDMLELLFVDFPVFNIADCAITIGTILLVIDTLFFDNKSLFSLMETKLKSLREKGHTK